MRKTHTFLEKLAPRTSDRDIQLGIGIRYIVGVIAIILPQQLIRGQIGIILLCHHQVCIPWMNRVLKHVTQKLAVDTVTWERNIGLYTILNTVSHYYFRWWWEWEKVSDCKYERKNSGGRETLTWDRRWCAQWEEREKKERKWSLYTRTYDIIFLRDKRATVPV